MTEKMTVAKLHELIKEGFGNMEKSFKKIDSNDKRVKEDINEMKHDLLEMKDQIIKNLVESNKKLQKKVESLERELQYQKEEIQSNNQYGRRSNIEVSGIPNSVKDQEVEGKIIEILQKIDVDISNEEVEACHRLPATRNNPTKRVIVRFVNRKSCEKSLKNKKKLKDIDMASLNSSFF